MKMLARVASNLFWIGRYMERAENTARLLDMGRRMAALPTQDGNRNEWESILASSGSDVHYDAQHDKNCQKTIVHHLVQSPDNPSSIYQSLKQARDNMRSIREGVSSDTWRAMNNFWLDFSETARHPIPDSGLADLIEQIKLGCMSVIGAIESTISRNETYDFLKLGTFTERVDNTARILDVKYFSLLPSSEPFEGGVDTMQWLTILEATSTRRLFRWFYGTDLRAATVVELLVQNQKCARSLAYCFESQRRHLKHLSELYDVETEALSRANHLFTSVVTARGEEILVEGLHEYLSECIRANNKLADQIAEDFHFLPGLLPSENIVVHEH